METGSTATASASSQDSNSGVRQASAQLFRPIHRCAGRRAAGSYRRYSRDLAVCAAARCCSSTAPGRGLSTRRWQQISWHPRGRARMRCARRDMLVDGVERRSREGLRIIENVAVRQRAECRVEVIEARVGECKRKTAHAKLLLDHIARGGVRAKTAAHPKQAAPSVPDAVAGAFERSPPRASRRPHRAARAPARRGNRPRIAGCSRRRSGWKKRARTALRFSTTAALAVNTRSGRPRLGLDGLDRGVSSRAACGGGQPIAGQPWRAAARRCRPRRADPSRD